MIAEHIAGAIVLAVAAVGGFIVDSNGLGDAPAAGAVVAAPDFAAGRGYQAGRAQTRGGAKPLLTRRGIGGNGAAVQFQLTRFRARPIHSAIVYA